MASVSLNEPGWQAAVDAPTATRAVEYPTIRFVWMLRLFCCVAMGISIYLAHAALTGSKVAGCGSGGSVFDCGHVLTSKWSRVFNIPVSVPAIGLYATALIALAFYNPNVSRERSEVIWTLMTFLALSAAMAALWFIGLQVFVIKHFCPWCLGAHTCGLLLCGAILWRRPVRIRQMAPLCAFAAAGLCGLATTQVFSAEPPKYEVERFDTEPNNGVTDSPDTFESPLDDDGFIGAPGDDDGVMDSPMDEEDDALFDAPVIGDDESEADDAGSESD